MFAQVVGSVLAANCYIAPPVVMEDSSTAAGAYFSAPLNMELESEPPIRQEKLYTDYLTSQVSSQSYDVLVNSLLGYLGLQEGWDGYGGQAPKMESVVAAIDLSNEIRRKRLAMPKPMLAGDGEVGLYWDEAGFFVDVGFEDGQSFSYFAKGEGVEPFGEDDVDPGRLPAKLIDVLQKISTGVSVRSAA